MASSSLTFARHDPWTIGIVDGVVKSARKWPRDIGQGPCRARENGRQSERDPAGPLDSAIQLQRRKGNAMKAFQLQEFGGPDALRPRRASPTRSPGPGQVLVRVRAVSLNYRDLLMSQRHVQPQAEASHRSRFRRGRRSRRDRGRASPGSSRATGSSPASCPTGWTARPTTRKRARRWEAAAPACWPSWPSCPSTGCSPFPPHLTSRGSRHLALRGRDRMERPGRPAAESSPATRSSSRAPAASRSSRSSSHGWPAHA